jgi:WD40 repeat protein
MSNFNENIIKIILSNFDFDLLITFNIKHTALLKILITFNNPEPLFYITTPNTSGSFPILKGYTHRIIYSSLLELHPSQILQIDNSYIAVAEKHKILIIAIHSGKIMKTLTDYFTSDYATNLKLVRGLTISAVYGNRIKIWDCLTGTCVLNLELKSVKNYILLDSNKYLVALRYYNVIDLYNIEKQSQSLFSYLFGEGKIFIRSQEINSGYPILDLCELSQIRFLIANLQGDVFLYEVHKSYFQVVQEVKLEIANPNFLFKLDDEIVLFANSEGKIYIFNFSKKEIIYKAIGLANIITINRIQEKHFLISYEDKLLQVYDLVTNQIIQEYKFNHLNLTCILGKQGINYMCLINNSDIIKINSNSLLRQEKISKFTPYTILCRINSTKFLAKCSIRHYSFNILEVTTFKYKVLNCFIFSESYTNVFPISENIFLFYGDYDLAYILNTDSDKPYHRICSVHKVIKLSATRLGLVYQNDFIIYDWVKFEKIGLLKFESECYSICRFKDDSFIVGTRNMLILYDLDKNIKIDVKYAHNDNITILTMIRDDILISYGLDNCIKFWRVKTNSFFYLDVIYLKGIELFSLGKVKEDVFFTADIDGNVKVWDMNRKVYVLELFGLNPSCII